MLNNGYGTMMEWY